MNVYEAKGEITLTEEERSPRRKTNPSANLSTTNSTTTDLALNPGLRSEKPAFALRKI
jgi:hypothetical protein